MLPKGNMAKNFCIYFKILLFIFLIPNQLKQEIAAMEPNRPPTPTNTSWVSINIIPHKTPTNIMSTILGNFSLDTIAA